MCMYTYKNIFFNVDVFVLHTKFVMFNILFVVYYYLFDMFKFFRKKYLFPIVEINYLV